MASHVLMGITKTAVVLPTMLSPLGKACARMDLTAVHDILLKTGYRDEEGAENEVGGAAGPHAAVPGLLLSEFFDCFGWAVQLSFQEWTQQVQEMLNTKKFGDIAFRDKDFKSAIDYYSKVWGSLSLSLSVFRGVGGGGADLLLWGCSWWG